MSEPSEPSDAQIISCEVAEDQRVTDLRGHPGPGGMFKLGGPIVGIDLGTVNSCVAFSENGTPRVLPLPGGHSTLPSIVYLAQTGEVRVGNVAREKMIVQPELAIYASKRFIGRPYESREVKAMAHFYNYAVVPSDTGHVAARVKDRTLTLEQVASHILAHLRQAASEALQRNVQRAVITVPAYFGETQRQAVRDAGRLAGLYVERVLNEPTAAAVAYGAGRDLRKTVLVYDLGGGTFDASLLRIDRDHMEVMASDGDAFLGGSDFDDRLTEWLLSRFERDTGVSLREQPVAVQRLRFAAEQAKIELSSAMQAQVNVPFITQTDSGPLDLIADITRERFEALTGDLVERTLTLVQRVLDKARLPATALDDVVVVGGQSRSPAVGRALFQRFGKSPSKQVHADEAVALGAAIVAEMIDSPAPIELVDVLPATLRVGLGAERTMVVLEQGAQLPAERRVNLSLSKNGEATRVFIYRGAAEKAHENTSLGSIELPGVSGDVGRRATLYMRVTSDGLLVIRAEHPTAGALGDLELKL
jgi:molecular chaperone DnaK